MHIKNFFSKFTYLRKTFFVLGILFLFIYFSMLRIDINHFDMYLNEAIFYNSPYGIDDVRFPNNIHIVFATLMNFINNIKICQIISIIFLQIASSILIYLFSIDKKITISKILCSMVIGITPAYLYLFADKYNCVIYTFSIFSALFPILFYTEKKYVFICISILFNFLSFIFCFSMAGIFPVVILLLSFFLYINGEKNKKIFELIISSSLSYACSHILYLIYKLIFNLHNDICFIIDYNIDDAIEKFAYDISFDFSLKFKIIIIAIILFFVITTIFKTKNNKILSFIFSMLIGLIIIMPFIFMFYKNMLACNEFAKMYYYSYSFILTIIMLISVQFDFKLPINKSICYSLIFLLITFSFLFGNLLYEQNKFDNYILHSIKNDLCDLDFAKNKKISKLIVIGEGGHAPILSNIGFNDKVIYKIVRPLNYLGYFYIIEHYFGKDYYIKDKVYDKENIINPINLGYITEEEYNNFNLYKDTVYYKILTNDKGAILLYIYKNNEWDKI